MTVNDDNYFMFEIKTNDRGIYGLRAAKKV